MKALLDTNIILRNFNRDDAAHGQVAEHLRTLAGHGYDFCVAPQILFELWVVVTRPAKVNGLGMDAPHAFDLIQSTKESYVFLPDPADLTDRWLELCVRCNAKGRHGHDVRLVAWMTAHDISEIITLNPAHFAAFQMIRVNVPK